MKILLVRPINLKVAVVIPNLGLGYLATQIRKRGHEVKILDCVKDRMSFSGFEGFTSSQKPDLVGIQMFTSDFQSVHQMVNIVKKVDPNIILILGGPHPSALPEETMQDFEKVDYLFRGEAEIGLPRLIQYLEDKSSTRLNDIPGLAFRNNRKVKMNAPGFVESLDELGFPSWDLMNPREYPPAPHGTFTKQIPTAPIITARGCPYRCRYCAIKTNSGELYRKRSIDNIIKEIRLLVNSYGIREIHIEDDNFTLDKERAKKFCHRLLEENLDISWACPNGVRLDTLTQELLILMEEAGCYSFAVGIESGSHRILEKMKREINPEEMEKRIKIVAETTKIKMTAYCMLGFPDETKEEMEETVNFTLELPLHRAQFSPFMPLPGTEIFSELIKKEEIDARRLDWDKYLEFNVVYSPKGISFRELKKIIRRAFARFYFRPKIIINLFKEIRSLHHLLIIIKRMITVFR